MKFIIGKKLDMTQIWKGDRVVAVTKVQAGPCVVVQLKKIETDGYQAVQLGYGEKKSKNINKPQKGHYKKIKESNSEFNVDLRFLREFREKDTEVNIGDVVKVDTFEIGNKVSATGISKGRGFQGVVKRHGFHGHNKSHGTKDQVRMPGSAGATGPAHVFKGKKMPGRMGADRITVKNLEIIEVDQANNILLIKGAIPGAKNGLILISGEGQLKVAVKDEKVNKVEKFKEELPAEKKEEIKSENKIEEIKEKSDKKKDLNPSDESKIKNEKLTTEEVLEK